MKFEFPDTGEGVNEGKLLEWKVNEGDQVEEDEVVAEAETDKAVVEVPSPADGIIKQLIPEPGDDVEVGEVIMELETKENDEKNEEDPVQEPKESESANEEEKSSKSENTSVQSKSSDILALPKVRKLAEDLEVDLGNLKNSGRVTESEVREAANKAEQNREDSSPGKQLKVNASPSVRQLAREKQVDITDIDGSGRGGKITRNDVKEAASLETSNQEKHSNDQRHNSSGIRESQNNESEDVEVEELSSTRKSIAKKMEESRFNKPHVTHVDKADVTELVDLREREKEEVDVHLTYLPFIMKATLAGLKNYPKLNSEYDGENQEIILKKDYNYNIAVDTDKGLMVPVVEDIDDKSIVGLAKEITKAADRAKNQSISRKEMSKGTFSITNLGVIGGEEFTPIINPPQTAILGIGKIQETAEVIEGEVKPRHTVKLSLSYDHRVIDGATAAKFMNTIIENLENPEKLLMKI